MDRTLASLIGHLQGVLVSDTVVLAHCGLAALRKKGGSDFIPRQRVSGTVLN